MNRAASGDCWNRIGVRGDASCPELQTHVHCRNCPVYTAAAVRLLEREAPAGYLQEWTSHYAGARPLDGAAAPASILVFRLAGEWLALPTSAVIEVASMRPLHSLPHRRQDLVLGVANVHGELLVCVSLSGMLGIAPAPAAQPRGSGMPRLLVTRGHGARTAFPVDEVVATRRYAPGQLQAVPATVAKAAAPYVKAVLAWQQGTLGLLDDELLFHAVERSLA